MKMYLVRMMQEQWIPYEAESAEGAKELARADYFYSGWTILGANDA